MILFDLKCSAGHVFEAWFRDSASYGEQQDAGAIICPYCESHVISKAPMAPSLAGTGSRDHVDAALEAARTGDPDNGELSQTPSVHEEIISPDEFVEGEAASRPGILAIPEASFGEYAHFAKEVISKLSEIRDTVEKNCDYVGNQFPEEARKIHYGETKERGIYGEATQAEAEDLAEEGIEFTRLPIKTRRSNS